MVVHHPSRWTGVNVGVGNLVAKRIWRLLAEKKRFTGRRDVLIILIGVTTIWQVSNGGDRSDQRVMK
jgi:hypothetical protein